MVSSWDGRKKCKVGPLSPHFSREVLLFSLWFCVILTVFIAVMITLNTLLSSGKLGPFLSRWNVEKTQQDRKTRGRSGFCWGEAVNLMKITAATSPAARWLPARSLIPGINSSGEPASLLNVKVLKNWNGYEVAHLRRLQEPQGGWTWQGETQSLPQHCPLGGPWNPLREEHITQRSPSQLQSPGIWALTFRRRRGVFQDGGQARSLPRSPVLVQRTGSGVNVLIVESP